MTAEEDFSRAILATPRDDALRLVFADWLDERGGRGDAERAEFIRLGVARPELKHFEPERVPDPEASDPVEARMAALCYDNWQLWADQFRERLADSPLCRWLGTSSCLWGYRRGLVAVFEGTQQVVLDAWHDLFRLGPVEEVQVNNLWHLGTISSLRLFLDRPSVRVLRLQAAELREDCVAQLQAVSGWFHRLEGVELVVQNPNYQAAEQLTTWLANASALKHVRWRNRRF